MMTRDYVFHINWTDRHMQPHKIGILAQIDEDFYLIIKEQEDASLAYKNGFIGIPGFNEEEVYKSGELFDFFRNRILESKRKLSKTGGTSMTDSFSVEEISEKLSQKYKRIILEAYDLQLRKEKMQEQNEEGTVVKVSKEDNSDEIPDI